MRWWLMLLVCCCGTGSLMYSGQCNANPAAAQSQLDWYIRDWPPVNILTGPQRGQGAYDLMLSQLINALPQYQHQLHYSSLTMRQQMMHQQLPHCLFGLLKTPQRQTFLRFSEPLAAIPNLHFIARADHPLWQQLTGQTTVSSDWLARQPLQGLAEQGRTYPAPLDKLASRLMQVTATETPLLQLLAMGRADYLLEFPDRAHFLAEQQRQQFRSMPITELPPLTEVYVACSLNKASKQHIDDINQVLAVLRQQPAWRQALLRWLSPGSQQLVREYMRQSIWFDGQAEAVPAHQTGTVNAVRPGTAF